jgi:hypothetical protein
MGERERRDSLKVLKGERILNIKTPTLWELISEPFLYPYRAYKQKRREAQIRQQMRDSISCSAGYPGNDENDDNEVTK